MNKLLFAVAMVATGSVITGCAHEGDLSEEARNNVPTMIWFDNANVLVDANDPDLKAETLTGVTPIDLIGDAVKDILVQVPAWTISKVEQKHFNSTYMECAKAVNSGADGAELVVKGEAFKSVLLMDTFAQEVEHATCAASKETLEQRKEFYAKNEEVYNSAVAKCVDYANNQIVTFETCADDEARKAFFADASREQWSARTSEIVTKIIDCVAKSDDEAAAKAAMAKLCNEMGVKEYDWNEVSQMLKNYGERLQKALKDFAEASTEPDLVKAMAKAAFGGEIVPGTSGKETVALIERFGKQLKLNVQMIAWLLKELGAELGAKLGA